MWRATRGSRLLLTLFFCNVFGSMEIQGSQKGKMPISSIATSTPKTKQKKVLPESPKLIRKSVKSGKKESDINSILEFWTLSDLQSLQNGLPHIIGENGIYDQLKKEKINWKEFPTANLKFGIPTGAAGKKYWKSKNREVNIRWQKLFEINDVARIVAEAKNKLHAKAKNSFFKEESNQENARDILRSAHRFDKDSVLHVIGDFQGGFHDVLSFFEGMVSENLEIKDKNNHFLVLGDMTDSGPYSLETLITLLVLFLKNPNNVHLIRGNHEDFNVNCMYGFIAELITKYEGKTLDEEKDNLKGEFYSEARIGVKLHRKYISELFDLMPVVLFGIFPDSKIIVPFCHGTIDLDDQLVKIFLENAVQNETVDSYSVFKDLKEGSGYQWNDHKINASEMTSNSSRGMGIKELSKNDTTEWLQSRAPDGWVMPYIMRAHQHTMSWGALIPLFFGHYLIAALWMREAPYVFTLCVNPASGFGVPNENFQFPGIITSTTVCIKNSGTIIELIRHPNMHIAATIKEQHKEILANNLFSYRNSFYPIYAALADDLQVYLRFREVKKIELQNASREHIKEFLELVIPVQEKETIATWQYNVRGKTMQLQQFFVPKKLREQLSISQKELNSINTARRLQGRFDEEPESTEDIKITKISEKIKSTGPSKSTKGFFSDFFTPKRLVLGGIVTFAVLQLIRFYVVRMKLLPKKN